MEHNLKQLVLRLLQSDLNHYNQAWDLDEETNLIMSGIQAGDLIDWKKTDELVKKFEDACGVVYELVDTMLNKGEDLKGQEDFITTKAAETAGLDSKYSTMLWASVEMAIEYRDEIKELA